MSGTLNPTHSLTSRIMWRRLVNDTANI